MVINVTEKNSTEEGIRSSEMLGMVEVIITLNREVKIELTEKVKKTNLSKDTRA